ncbi:FecR domain-containing protein [Sphingomonas sp. GM_Shp_2]|uniref:FecR family protein n=1 Tax=Sphingomonas sp. GM_Shp_2 TaxID=2937380 RepID=UPI00226AD41B|nr:FecR domain-containing protein [Sphingomonas sp. GM_Shp_2]
MRNAATPSADVTADAAALWLVRREEPQWSKDDDAMLQAWLNQSMAHKAAFWRLEHGWRAADRIVAVGREPASEVRPRRRLRLPSQSIPRRRLAAIAVAALASVAVIVLTTQLSIRPGDRVAAYRTPTGGNRVLRLADGSRVQMNTATAIRAGTTPDAREVWLDEGEAYFDVAHRPDRKFVVHAGVRTITVLGTRFSVRREKDRVTVAVISGRVRVDDAQASASVPKVAIVSAGNVAIIEPRSTLISTTGSDKVAALMAWREQMIVFDDKPLSDIVTDFNRYSKHMIVIEDRELANVRLGGAFKTHDSEAFVKLLRAAYRVRVREDGDAVILYR